MTVKDLLLELNRIVKDNPEVGADALVMVRPPMSGDTMLPAQLTLTYTSVRRNGTTAYDQVPVILFEEAEDPNG